MYTSFFGLNEKPFSITPDPRYLYLSGRHAEALAHLIYGVKESGGFIQLTGEVGTGKTTLVRSLLQQLPEFADVAVVLNSQLSRAEFLGSICEELHTELPEQRHSTKALTDVLNAYLLQNHSLGRRTILIVDEAQNLRRDVLEQIRLLTNLETAKQKLLQIILIGQPELREMLARNDLRQLAQRITGRYHLEPLSLHETGAYIDHRLQIAGAVSEIFPARAKRELFRLSGGVPRMINVIADRVLLGAYTQGDHRVTPELVRTAAGEVFDRPTGLRGWLSAGWNHPGRWAGMGVAGFLLVLGLGFAGSRWLPALTGANGADARSSDVTPVALPLQPPPAATPMPAGGATQNLGRLLQTHGSNTGTDTAFRTLFSFWKMSLQKMPPRPCVQAEAQGLQCLYRRGTLDQVRTLGLPAILALSNGSSTPHQVVLASLGLDTATINIGGQVFQVATSELEQWWFGEYLLLWRPETPGGKAFLPGNRNPAVPWLRASLSQIQGTPVNPMDSDLFDEQLADRVRDYQSARRLPVDGVADAATQVAIGSDLGDGTLPRLAAVP